MDIQKPNDFQRIDKYEKAEAYRILNLLKAHQDRWFRSSEIAELLEMKGQSKRKIQRYISYLKFADPKHNFVTSDMGNRGYIFTRDPEIFRAASRKLTKFYKNTRDHAQIDDYQGSYLDQHGFKGFLAKLRRK
ncbi:hypothetical protein [Oenococcus sp.]|uniref:hypothetical protein n=1 Tax=Oenococcus sp. TaxID=1979414 RepID=UPI0039EB8E61